MADNWGIDSAIGLTSFEFEIEGLRSSEICFAWLLRIDQGVDLCLDMFPGYC